MRQHAVAHGVNPSVKRVESTGSEAVLDRAGADAGSEQLRSRDDSVLPSGDRPEQLVRAKVVRFAPYDVVNLSRLAHDPDGDRQFATELAPSVRKLTNVGT